MKSYTAVVLLVAATALLSGCERDTWYDDYHYRNWTWGNNNNNSSTVPQEDDEDFFVAMAQTLAGQWRGDMRAYQLDDKGTAIDSMDLSTDIEFVQYNDRSISGTGTQYDFEPRTDVLRLKRDFTWYIDPKTGSIYLTYKEKQDDGTVRDYVMSIAYDDLNLDNRTFTGYLWASDGYEVDDFLFNRYQETTRAKAASGVTRLKMVMR